MNGIATERLIGTVTDMHPRNELLAKYVADEGNYFSVLRCIGMQAYDACFA